MKKGRFSALLCAGMFLVLLFAPASRAENSTSSLSFDEDDKFEILILADAQDVATPQTVTLALEAACLDAAQPDLVVFLGDQLHGPSLGNSEEAAKKGIDALVAPVAARGIPFAVVFGNHDSEGAQPFGGAFGHGTGYDGVTRQTQMGFYQAHKGCLAIVGPKTLPGCGNYVLTVATEDGTPGAALWFLDSGAYSSDGYAAVSTAQIDWCAAESKVLTAQAGAPVPGYVFQHIIVPEIYDALTETTKDDPDAVQGQMGWKGHWFKTNSTFTDGTLGEGPCPPNISGGQFDGWLAQGDIRAAFFGHDHANSFVCSYKGIDLVAAPGIGFYIYGGGPLHGARTVTLSPDGTYETSVLLYADVMDEPLPGGLVPTMGALAQQIIVTAAVCLMGILALAGIVTVLLVHRKKKIRLAEAEKETQTVSGR